MSGHKPFKNLSDRLRSTPEGQAAVERQGALLRDMLALYKLHEGRGVTQAELAKVWDTSAPVCSEIAARRIMP